MRAFMCAVFLAVLTSVGGCDDEFVPYNPLDPMVRFGSELPEVDLTNLSTLTPDFPTFGHHLNINLDGLDDGWVGGCIRPAAVVGE